MLSRSGGKTSVPQIFVDGKYFGGLKELKEYFRPQLKAQEQDGDGKRLYNYDETAWFTFSTKLIYEYPEEIRLQEVELTQRKKILDNTKKAQVLMKRAVLIGRERKLCFYTKR